MPQQLSLGFPDEPRIPQRAEPPQARIPRHHNTSLCHYCGQRVPNWMLRHTLEAKSPQWMEIAQAHQPGCAWIRTTNMANTSFTSVGSSTDSWSWSNHVKVSFPSVGS
jgi:hypothetical protein